MFRHATIYCKYDKDYWNRHIVDNYFYFATNIEIIDNEDLYVVMNGQSYLEFKSVDARGNIIETVFVLKCKKCGDLKTKVIINTNLYGR